MSSLENGSQRTRGILKILVADDERPIADSLAKVLNLNGFSAIVAYSGFEAVTRAQSEPFDILLADVMMPGMTGIEAFLQIRKLRPKCRVMLLSGDEATTQLLSDARDCGHNFEIFAKPVHPLVIIERLRVLSRQITKG